MYRNILQIQLLIGTVMLLSFQTSEGISCFVCHSNISGIDTGCARVSTSQSISNDLEKACYTTVSDDDGRPATVSRGFSSAISSPYCSSSGSSCYCNGNDCNGQSIDTPSYTCYVCDSTPMLPSGCADGVDWNSGSEYVIKEAGCYACGKTKNFDGSVSRWCEQTLYAPNECTTSLTLGAGSSRATYTTTCYCRGDHCNSAKQLTISTGIYLTLLLISAAFF